MLSQPVGPPGGDRFAHALETCRAFLLAIANAEMPGQLTPKGGASDLVQDALAAAYRGRDRFQGQTLADLRAWLRGILINELATFRRRYRAARRDAAREVALPAALPHPTSAPEPVDDLIRAERDTRLDAALAGLPAYARQVLLLRLEQRLAFREIGARLGRTEEAARKLFVRALDRLRTGSTPAA